MNILNKTSKTILFVRIVSLYSKQSTCCYSTFCPQQLSSEKNEFGIICDVDGVLTRGCSALKAASNAFNLLKHVDGAWRAPVLFLTNACNVSKHSKARELSKILNQEIRPSNIMMSYTALRLYTEYFDKHVAICGQGPTKDISRSLGFSKTSTIEEIVAAFPFLDACKPKDTITNNKPRNDNFEKIEAVLLLGEPQVWERNLQILLDLLLHHGEPNKSLEECGTSKFDEKCHLPVIACSSDLVWSGAAPSPRIAHGSFLVCLEALYEKMSGGYPLKYTSLIGKPSPATYTFAVSQLNAIASKYFNATEPLKRIYCIGDNPDIDIYGANLYNICLQTMPEDILQTVSSHVDSLVQEENPSLSPIKYQSIFPCGSVTSNKSGEEFYRKLVESSVSMPLFLRDLVSQPPKRISPCVLKSILVLTGVYQNSQWQSKEMIKKSFGHPLWRDLHQWFPWNWSSSNVDKLNSKNQLHHIFPNLPNLRVPNFVAKDVEEAMKYIISLEDGSTDPGEQSSP